MKQQWMALFLIAVMVASVFAVVAATTTPVAAATATQTGLSVSTTCPAPNQQVTFAVKLKAGTTGLSKSVKIWHLLPNGQRANDPSVKTVNGVVTFKVIFTSVGKRVYHAEFAGDSAYGPSAASPVTINVANKVTPSLSLTASTTFAAPNQQVTFTVKLKAGTTGLSKSVKIWHLLPNGQRANDPSVKTVNGVVTFKVIFTSVGKRVYHAEFAGDCSYKAASSNAVTETVKTRTKIILTVKLSCLGFEQGGIATVDGQVLTASGAPVRSAYVFLYEQQPGYETIWHLVMKGYADAQGNFTTSRFVEHNMAYKYKAVFSETASYFGASQEAFTWGC